MARNAEQSLGTSRYTTIAALRAADMFVGSDPNYTPVNDEQRSWLKRVYEHGASEIEQLHEIQANATQNPDEHVRFLAKHGWDAQITTCPPKGFLTAAVLDLLVHWVRPGQQHMIRIDGVGEFPAVYLDHGVEVLERREDGGMFAKISTKTGSRVLIAMPERAPSDVLALDRLANELFEGPTTPHRRTHGITFPMVDLTSKQKFEWLAGLTINGANGEFVVTEAVQQATLKMNHEGARARTADEMGIRATSAPPPPLQIDRPFVVAFERPGVARKVYTAYVGYDAWKDPGSLGA